MILYMERIRETGGDRGDGGERGAWLESWRVPVKKLVAGIHYCSESTAIHKAHYKEPIPKIGNKFSQKRNCEVTVPKFPHSCVCERLIYSHDRFA
jgi:hypothetical protein